MQPLDINHFPLIGQSLIEASAGTGKTYTISHLYSRLVLGHQSPIGRLSCQQLLVVTFTRAATEELRGRIRQILQAVFLEVLAIQQGSGPTNLELYERIKTTLEETHQPVEELADWLQANLSQMDEAAVYTIHGFCQRVLVQFAFDSGVIFDAELFLEAEEYFQQACEDVWRQQTYSLSLEQSQFIASNYVEPGALLRRIKSWLARPEVRFIPEKNSLTFEEDWLLLEKKHQKISELWQEVGKEALQEIIEASDVNKRSYSKRHLPGWLHLTEHYFSENFSLPYPDQLEKLTATALKEKTKVDGKFPEHTIFSDIDDFCQQASDLKRQQDLRWFEKIRQQYVDLLEKNKAFTPDDLLRLLSRALSGEKGEELARQIRQLYPVAMIDEFQDTDARQYEIFNAIYPPDHNNTNYGLIMIGDPKQAIYSFRGADIFTYIKARRQLSDQQRYTLDTNWRSHSHFISAVNFLFQRSHSPFIFNQDIPFSPVQAAGQSDEQQFRSKNKEKPCTFWLNQDEMTREEAQHKAASECASQIASCLQPDNASFGLTSGQKPVKAEDIAVLVRSRKQAALIRQELMEHGVGSVFLTRGSIYDTQEARDVFVLLTAVAEPGNENAVRNALATLTQGYSSQQLDNLLYNVMQWEKELETFQRYHQQWQQSGIMATMMNWLGSPYCHDHSQSLAVKLRKQVHGERVLTNLLHLAELLQGASRKIKGQASLLRWFGERVFDDGIRTDETQLRLETDANLVTIVTIHKSKGLEYPLVFLPFLWDDSYHNHQDKDVFYYQDAKERSGVVLNLKATESEKDLAVRDHQAEAMRLLYVAITRAKQACFIWLMNAVDGRKKPPSTRIASTALGYLLDIAAQPDWQAVKNNLAHDHIQLSEFPQEQCVELYEANHQSAPETLKAAEFSGEIYDGWRVSSYSQLTSHQPDNYEQEFFSHPNVKNTQSLPAALTFDRGTNPGTCLHAILENWDFTDNKALSIEVEKQLTQYGLTVESNSDHVQTISDWLFQVAQCCLYSKTDDFCLSDIEISQRLDEMEFYLPVGNSLDKDHSPLTANAINQLMENKQLSFDPLNGYIKGFIDLIFCYKGRYYIADYKSNYLGDRADNYLEEALSESMQQHHYDVQAWIYTLALDRYLAKRLPDYQPEKYLGGTFYLYLRGMNSTFSNIASDKQQQHPGVFYQPVDIKKLHDWRALVMDEER